MFGLGSLGTKLIIATVVIAIVTATIGGYWLYQKSLVDGLQNQIVGLQNKVAEMIIANESLKLSNTSLELRIVAHVEQNQQIREEIGRLKVVDDAAQAKLAEYENQLRDIERKKKIARLLKSRMASLLLRKMDARIKCEIIHFEEIDGKCVEGQWVKTGERLVPKEKTSSTKDTSKNLITKIKEAGKDLVTTIEEIGEENEH